MAPEVVFAEQAIEVPLAEAREPDGFRRVPVRPSQRIDEGCSFSLICDFSSLGPRQRRDGQDRCRLHLSEFERKVRDLERITVGKYHSPLNNVLELANVAGP
jgi:hypothetical protein